MFKKVIRLIPKSFRKKGVAVSLFVPVRALLDLVGIAVLLPVLILVLDGNNITQNSILSFFYDSLGFTETRPFVVFIVLAVLGVIVLKSAINLFFINFQNKYLLSLYKYFSSKMLSALYNRGLLYVKDSNSSEISFNINSVCYNFVVAYLASILKFSGEFIFCIFLLSALCIYNPLSALLIVVSFVPVILIYLYVVKKRLKYYGKAEMEARRRQQRTVQETFRGYAEMEINNAFPLMKEKFDKGLNDISEYRVKTSIIQSIPSYMLEIAVAVVVSVMVLFSLSASDASMRVFLGIFAVAMIRMLPSVRSLISTWSGFKSTQYTVDVIDGLCESNDSSADTKDVPPLCFEHSINVRNLSFSYPTGNVIDKLSFEIRKGERFGIRGRTGAGKSTLFNLLLGLLPPQEGSIEIDGIPLSKGNIKLWQALAGYVPQDVFISDGTLAENIALGRNDEEIDYKKVEEVIERAALKEFADSLPEGVKTVLGESGSKISGGQRQRVGIARALYKNAEVLFFDEATSSLDTKTEKEVNDAIQNLSKTNKQLTIIIISHRESSLSFCDRIYELK